MKPFKFIKDSLLFISFLWCSVFGQSFIAREIAAGAEITGVVYGSALERGDIDKNEAVLIAAKKLGKKLAG